jgi:hypothetical protein
LSEGFPDQRSRHCVVTTDAPVDFTEHLQPLLLRDAFLQDP